MNIQPEILPLEWDHARDTCLCESSSNRYHAGTAIGPDGTEYLMLADFEQLDRIVDDLTCVSAPHEQLGPLPDTYMRRLQSWPEQIRQDRSARPEHNQPDQPANPTPTRCGHPTNHGQPCHNVVRHDGQPCWRHQQQRHRSGQR